MEAIETCRVKTAGVFALQVKQLLGTAKLMLRTSRGPPLDTSLQHARHARASCSASQPSHAASNASCPSAVASSAQRPSSVPVLRGRPAAAVDIHEPFAPNPFLMVSTAEAAEDHECCIVCMERPAVVTFMPCRHTLTCQPCAKACLQRSSECLICRSSVTSQLLVPDQRLWAR